MKKWVYSLIFLSLIVLSVTYFSQHKKTHSHTALKNKQKKFQYISPSKKASDSVALKMGPIKQMAKEEKYPPQCKKLFKSLLITDLSLENFLDLKKLGATSCIKSLDAKIQNAELKSQIEVCLKETNFKPNSLCASWLFMLRALAIDLIYDSSNLENYDSNILINKIVGSFMQMANPSRAMLKNNIAMSDILISRDPNLYPAYKAKLMNLLLQELIHGNINLQNEMVETWESMSQFTLDEDIQDFPLLREFIKNQNNEADLNQFIDDYLTQNPQSVKAHYFKAGIEWKSGNKEAAKLWLNKAHKLDPQNNDIRYTLDLIDNANSGDAIFRITMGINFSQI
jgi:hypothetical protein